MNAQTFISKIKRLDIPSQRVAVLLGVHKNSVYNWRLMGVPEKRSGDIEKRLDALIKSKESK